MIYDQPTTEVLVQANLRNRISATEVYNGTTCTQSTYYSYDAHGNVKEMLHQYPQLTQLQTYKHIAYDYDLISNKVTVKVFLF